MTTRRAVRYEKRIRLVEAAWRRFVPNIELSFAIHAVESQPGEVSSLGRQGADGGTRSPAKPAAASAHDVDITEFAPALELELERADALEWDESADLAAIADGIGSLSVDRKGTGYMGPQSGNALLRYLQSISTFFPSSEDDFNVQWHDAPKPGFAEDVFMPAAFSNLCVDWYFKHFHSAYPILHEGFFRAQFMGKA
jgi:transcriptional regulatory protein GAL4